MGLLISDGAMISPATDVVVRESTIYETARAAIGYTTEGTMIIMVVDGRQAASRGVNLEELAGLMLDVGAFEAMNLDGGGSSTLVVNNILINRPTGGTFQREVMSAIATFVK